MAAVASETSTTEDYVTTSPRNQLPSFLRDYTKLGPLGKKQTFAGKTTGLAMSDLARRLTHDLTEGSTGKGGYFLTGDLSTDIFRDDCVFEDPTNGVASLSQYQKALTVLFDPSRSSIEVIQPLVVNESDCTISGRLRSRGYLQLPWNPYISSYETTIRYTVDPETGLVARQDQTWTKSASQALQETFTPTWVDPPPKSGRGPKFDEPQAVSKLFQMLNGRRPSEYSSEERQAIDALVAQIVEGTTTNASSTTASPLTGTWVLAYLQPGPDGAGIDRRIPFPDFKFNDNYQLFDLSETSSGRVTTVGQLFGPLANVQVYGSIREANPQESSLPRRRYEANIQGGKLCFSRTFQPPTNCWIDLPMIQGQGLFDSLYVGDRLRIGQNLNGGGARVVQLRI
ncbi:DUF2358 domain containing protein [Nitzschia inconspicua]|uniref:DUF2358 domain containing protein n=1 Tax=Nitzschia inconspicua TaxID=303405 RepID=A0A9K3Q581_9STRA|nr:DUF2358 domain containing protein [Nitzschia inconspicua]